jgi:NAD(P)-dependent dehydrogenase (short-subunit alcohol dehydrogenase family)
MNLEGKRALVTGGALRAGRAIAKAFAKAGAKIVVHYRDSGGQAAELVEELGGVERGHSCVGYDLEAVESLGDFLAMCGPLDILVNNASSYFQRSIVEETLEDAKAQFDVNFRAPAELMRLFAGQSGERELAVVNILDQRIGKVDPLGFSYPLSKKLLAEATLSAALQLAPRVRVNAVAPGPVFPPKGLESSKMEKTLANVPLRRAVAPEDLADACVFLAANDSITGAILHVDCGQHLS